jgi:polyisoprenoid-binding protein YceI
MRTIKKICPLLLLFFFLGCAKNPADDVPKADVSSATNAAEAAKGPDAPEPGARTYAFGPDASKIEFIGSKVTGKHNGGFKKFSGELRVINGRLAEAGNKVVIDTTSVWADNDRLTGHLKSPDFFNVAEMPTATFVTTSITQQGTNHNVTGNLTLHGVTKQISFPAKIQVSPETVEVAAEFFINRFDFEMRYPGKADDLIRKEVVLKLKVKAAPGKADFGSLQQAANNKPTPEA